VLVNTFTSEMTKEELEKIKHEMIGKVVIGTVKGDVHDIGKNIVTTLLKVNGFEVYDLDRSTL